MRPPPPFLLSTSAGSTDGLEWPESGWAPVFVTDVPRDPTPADLVGFTSFTMIGGVRRFMFTTPADFTDAKGQTVRGFRMREGAKVIPYGPDGDEYLAWHLVGEDPELLPRFWRL